MQQQTIILDQRKLLTISRVWLSTSMSMLKEMSILSPMYLVRGCFHGPPKPPVPGGDRKEGLEAQRGSRRVLWVDLEAERALPRID